MLFTNTSISSSRYVKVERTFDIVPLCGPIPSQRCSGMACTFKGSHSFTCSHTIIHECSEPYLPLPSQLVLIYWPRRNGRPIGLGTTVVSKQSAQDHYVMEITVISCSDRHSSPGNWKCSRPQTSNSRPCAISSNTNALHHRVTQVLENVNKCCI